MNRAELKDRELIQQALQERSKNVYWDCIFALRKRKTSRIYALSLELLESKQAGAEKLAINILAQLGTDQFRKQKKVKALLLRLLMQPKRSKLISTLLLALGHNNDHFSRKTIEKIATFRKSNKKKVRYAVSFALLGVENPKAVNTLIYLSKDKCKFIRDWSVFGLANVLAVDSKKLRKALWARVSDKDKTTRLEAILGLASRNDRKIIDVIHQEIEQGDFGVLLFDAIQEIGNLETLAKLNQLSNHHRAGHKVALAWLIALEDCIVKLKSKFN